MDSLLTLYRVLCSLPLMRPFSRVCLSISFLPFPLISLNSYKVNLSRHAYNFPFSSLVLVSNIPPWLWFSFSSPKSWSQISSTKNVLLDFPTTIQNQSIKNWTHHSYSQSTSFPDLELPGHLGPHFSSTPNQTSCPVSSSFTVIF